jgi:hypothetical protein
VARGVTVRYPFLLANTLDEAVTIVQLRPSCGCTSGRANLAVIPPGGQAVIEAAMDTTNFVGRKVTTLFVSLTTASGKQQEVGLGVSSTILSDIVLNPGTIDFGAVSKGQSVVRSLTIDRVDAPTWRAERMVSGSRVIDARLDETSRSSESIQYRLTVQLKPDAPVGVIRDEIRIVTNDRESPVVPVLITGQVLGEIAVSPSLLALGRVSPQGTAQGRFLIRATRPFQIVGIEGQGDGFTLVEVEPGVKPLHVLTLTYRPVPEGMGGIVRHAFRVATDLPGEAPVELSTTVRIDP